MEERSLGIFMSAYSIMQFFFAPYWEDYPIASADAGTPDWFSGYGLTFFLFWIAGNIPWLILIMALSA